MSQTPPTAAPADDPIETLGAIGVIPLVVIDDAARAAPLAEALLAGGIRAAEITLRTPAAMAALEIMAEYPGFLAGAGTLLDPRPGRTGGRCWRALGCLLWFRSPRADACRASSPPVLPGAVTATEIQHVRRTGIRVCKFYPGEAAGGLRTLSALSAPFPEMRFVTTGGIGPTTAAGYLRAPYVHAVGGTWIAARELIAAGRRDRNRELSVQAAAIAAGRPAGTR